MTESPPPPSNKPEKPEPFDVAVVVGVSDDRERAQVVRLKPEGAEVGELRPLKEGVPISGEVVELKPREGASGNVYDVEVKHAPPVAARRSPGPAKVSSDSYREGWERIFSRGGRGGGEAPN